MKIEDVVIGKRYIIRDIKWCYARGRRHLVNNIGEGFPLTRIHSKGIASLNVFIPYRGTQDVAIPIALIDPDPTDTREFSQDILDTIDELNSVKYLHSEKRSGGGRQSNLYELSENKATPMFNYKGDESVMIPSAGHSITTVSLKDIKTLLRKGCVMIHIDWGDAMRMTEEINIGNNKEEMGSDFTYFSSKY